MKRNDLETWNPPTQTVAVENAKLGRVRVTLWSDYHFRQSPKRSMARLRVEVLEHKQGKPRLQPMWLAWWGKTMPPLETLWLSY